MPRWLLLACWAVVDVASVPDVAPARRNLQVVKKDPCGCQKCVDAGTPARTCASFSLDCNCYICLKSGQTAAVCSSFGLDCKCYSDEAPKAPGKDGY